MSGGNGDSAAGDGSLDADSDADSDVVLRLPEDARGSFKDPFGPIYTDVDALVADHGGPYLTVGDIVTYHFVEAGHPPDVAFVDGRTKREAAPEEVRVTLEERPNRLAVANPAGTITADLFAAVDDALAAAGPTTVVVDGEEDLAAVPAVLSAPDGATVVYGQPDQGMVAIPVTAETKAEFRELLSVFEGDLDRARDLVAD